MLQTEYTIILGSSCLLIINMTILQLLNGENVNYLHVNVLKQISSTQFIVGDRTGIAIMTTESNISQHIELGKGLKMVKPYKIDQNVISPHPKFNPMKTKPMQMDVNYDAMDELEQQEIKTTPVNKGLNFKQIETDFGDNAIINDVLAYVTFASRKIEGKYGPYQICNLVDVDGNSVAINLYKHNIDKLETNKVYKLEKIKKTTISSADSKLRMGTTPFTKIAVAKQSEIDLFADVKIADKKVDGMCLMFNNLNYYRSCKKHLTKLDDMGCCSQCGQMEKDDEKLDFRCSLVINTSDDDMVEIVIFLRHLNIKINENHDESELIEMIEQTIVGKMCQVHYNENGDDNNVAVKLMIN